LDVGSQPEPALPQKTSPEDAVPSSKRHGRGSERSGKPERALSDVELLAEIGRELRSVYNDLFREPVPEHLVRIIERLEQREGKALP
jgi:hypothetical protein